MRPSSVRMPVAEHAVASPPVQAVPLNTRSRASRQRHVGPSSVGRPRKAGSDSPVSVERSTSSAPVEQPGVGADALALVDGEHVAGHEPARR